MTTGLAGLGETAGLSAALTALAQTPRLLVALDFDGTLAPLTDQPLLARVLPESARAIAELEVLPSTWVAYISGRSLEGLRRVIPADDLAYLVGSHGVEVQYGPRAELPGLTAQESEVLGRLGEALGEVVAGGDGARLEQKPVGYGVHTRGLDPTIARRVNEAASRAATGVSEDLVVRNGKDILEFSVRDATKGDAIRRMRAHAGATGVFFAGDDVTDEDGFAVLEPGDLGLKVGAGPTGAEHRVGTPDDVARVLTALAAERSGRRITASRDA